MNTTKSALPRRLFLALTALAMLASCKNVDQFQGRWRGDVSQSRLVRRGLDFCTSMDLTIDSVDSASLSAHFTLTAKADATVCAADVPGEGDVVPLPSQPIVLSLDSQFLNDSLSGMTLDGDPLFTHLAHAVIPAPWGDEPVIVFLSYYTGRKIRVRVVSKNIFAVFTLERAD